MRVLIAIVGVATLSGCILEGGAGVARAFHVRSSRPDHQAWGGHVAAAMETMFIHAGVELDGRTEHKLGSLISGGLQLGVASTSESSRVNGVAHVDLGVPLAWGAREGWYSGLTAELSVRLDKRVPIAERNRNYRIVGSSTELAPYVRLRLYHLVAGGHGDDTLDLGIGVALRLRLSTDLL